jgi:2-iminobutanoate/2-iminopropanoate deaminase
MKKAISTNGAPAAIGPYSQAIDCGEFVFTSGQLGLDPATGKLVDGGVQAQATQAMKNIQAVLTAAGLTLDNVVKTTVLLTNIADFAGRISPPLTRSTPPSLRELPTPHAAPIR